MANAAIAPARPVRWYNFAAYGSNDILGAGSMAVISTWVLFFYTTFCGLSAAQATLIFGIARVLDAVASPTIGYISDRFGNTWAGRRFGRRRAFVLAAIPLLPSFAIMWVAGQSFWYYLVTYVLFEMVYALEIIPYETLAAEMATDYKTKAKFAGARILCGQVSAIGAAFLPGWLIAYLGPDSPDTYLYMGIIFSVLFMGAAALLYTDVSRDGLEQGPNVRDTAALARAVSLPILASGGVASVADIERLAAVPGVVGVVVGRALYSGAVTLPAAMAAGRR